MRVEIRGLGWGDHFDRHGNARAGLAVKLKNIDGTDATVYAADTGGTTITTTGDLLTVENGNLNGFVDVGTYTITFDDKGTGRSDRRIAAQARHRLHTRGRGRRLALPHGRPEERARRHERHSGHGQ
jgi:hypothetical protein